MREVRVQPVSSNMLYVSTMCDCGSTTTSRIFPDRPEVQGIQEFKHSVLLGREEFDLQCKCGTVYHVKAQSNHIHVTDMGISKAVKR